MRSLKASLLPVLPLAGFYVAFFVAPFLVLAALSLFDDLTLSRIGVAQYRDILTDGTSLWVLLRTLRLGASVTVLSLLLGYAVAYVHEQARPAGRIAIILVVITPLLTSTVVRAFAWIVILGRFGPVNQALVAMGAIASPLRLLGSEGALVVAMAQIEMPLMVLPLITSFSSIGRNLPEASRSLGASRFQTFARIELPLSRDGAVAGAILVFAGATSSFISQSLIGGGRLMFMPVHIYEQAVTLQNWPRAAALSVLLVASVLLVVSLLQRAGRTFGVQHG